VSARFDAAVRGRADRAAILLTDHQIAKFEAFYELLSRWTRTINLTSLPLEGYPELSIDRLLIEPLLAARFFGSAPPHWLDLGTGSGSPAVPLRIVQRGGSLEMIESRERKAAFLREVVRELDLERTEVRTGRIEEVAASAPAGVADVITMRAVKPTFPILHAAAQLLKTGGRFLIFGSNDGATAAFGDPPPAPVGLELTETAPLLEPVHRLQVLTRR
jgi:16S rRNA (guanine527-N7)-methyltransferase